MRSAAELRTAIQRQRPNLQRLAEQSGVSRGTIYNLLRGRTPHAETLRRIDAALASAGAELADDARSAADRLRREAAYVRSFDDRSARERARGMARDLTERVTATRDLAHLHELVAERLSSAVRHAVADQRVAARVAEARAVLEAGAYDTTLRLLGDVSPQDREQWPVARWIAGEALRMLGKWDEAAAAVADALRSSDPAVRAWAYWNRAKLFEKHGRYRAARQDFERALALADNEHVPRWEADDIRAWTYWGLAWVQIHGRHADEALATFNEASRAAPPGDAGVQIWIAHGLGHLLVIAGEHDEARDIYASAIDLARAIHNEHYTAWMYAALAGIALIQGAYGPASTLARRAADVYAAHAGGSAPGRAYAVGLACVADAASGKRSWADAAVEIERHRRVAKPYAVAFVELSLFETEALRQAGTLDRALERADATIDATARHRLSLLSAHAHLARASVLNAMPAIRSASMAKRRALADARRALKRYAQWHCVWGELRAETIVLCLERRPITEELGRLAKARFPVEAAMLASSDPMSLAGLPLAFPGD